MVKRFDTRSLAALLLLALSPSLAHAPPAFVTVMAIGGVLGMMAISIPFVEQGIVASVLVLGVLIAAAVQLPLVASMTLVGLFALFHGHAYGVEMPDIAAGLAYGLGFIWATTCLHGIGICLGVLAQRFLAPSDSFAMRAARLLRADCT